MKKISTKSVNTQLTGENDWIPRSLNAQGKLTAKVLTLREYWDYQLPDGSGSSPRTRKQVLSDLKVLKNPKRLTQVIRIMDQNFLTRVDCLPLEYRQIIAKSFIAALDMERVEAMAYERLGLKAGPKAD